MFADVNWSIVGLAVLAVVVFLIFLAAAYSSRYLKAGPNEAIVVSGRRHRSPGGQIRGYKIVSGGGVFVWPFVEKADRFSLETMTIDIRTPEVYTTQGVPVSIDGVAQLKVKNDDVSIATAVEQFLSKSVGELIEIARQTLEGHLRAIIGTITVEEVIRNRDVFAQKVQEVSASDLANMGLTIISFTIKDIKDQHGYLEALGKPNIAQVKRNAVIAEAEAQRDANIKSAEAKREGELAKYLAETRIAEAQKNYKKEVANYTAEVNQKQAEADLAYDLQRYKTEQSVKAEEIEVQTVEKTKQIEVQEKEILRKQKELEATIQKPADAERYRIEALANAEQFKLKTTAAGQAEATKLTGFADADSNKAKGLANADIIKAQGLSEAEAMTKKAEAWKLYNEAAITQMYIERLPDIMKAVAEPLSRIDRYVVVSSGGDGGGASRIVKDVTDIVSQLPPVLEALTGLDLEELIKTVPKMKKTVQGSATDTVTAVPGTYKEHKS
ncbi:MAG: SPFH domain-containing protein [Chloroflexi bacterium]|nr:SPFH domain-containing protein [Chloroflexota bacterium]